MKAELINVGRAKICKTVEFSVMEQLVAEVKKHLLSSDVWIEQAEVNQDFELWDVYVGFGRPVGKVKIYTTMPF